MSRAWPVKRLNPEASLGDNARRIVAVRVAEFYSFAPIVADESAVEELHNLRIAAKRLRYSLELFRGVFGARGEKLIEQVKTLQEHLGQLHDYDVRIALIEEELRGLAAEQLEELQRILAVAPVDEHRSITTTALRPPPDDPRRGLLALLGRQHAARKERFQSFLATWRRFDAEGMRRDLVGLSNYPLSNGTAEVNHRPSIDEAVTLPATQPQRMRGGRSRPHEPPGTPPPAPEATEKRPARSPRS
jgi:hypothetical protein